MKLFADFRIFGLNVNDFLITSEILSKYFQILQLFSSIILRDRFVLFQVFCLHFSMETFLNIYNSYNRCLN